MIPRLTQPLHPPGGLILTILLGTAMVAAIPGDYVSNDLMNNYVLPNDLRIKIVSAVKAQKDCLALCVKNDECDAFTYSSFYKNCQMYKMKVGSKTIPSNNHKLYVRERSTDDGYFKYGTDYVKFVPKMSTAAEAEQECVNLGGHLAEIKDQELNDLIMEKIMIPNAVFYAYIDATDAAQEMVWTNRLGAPLTYTNWDWNAVWERRDRNCAIMRVDGTWRHVNCNNKYYVLCKMGMF